MQMTALDLKAWNTHVNVCLVAFDSFDGDWSGHRAERDGH